MLYTTLDEYQRVAFEASLDSFDKTGKALVDMAMGLGKTRVAAYVARKYLKYGKCLFLCHRNHGLEQSMKEFRKVLGDTVKMGLFHGEKKCWEDVDILFASFQTFAKQKHLFPRDKFCLVIVDEAHYGQAPTFKGVIAYFISKALIGLTGTPNRMDQKDIGEIFGPAVISVPVEKAIAQGLLAEVKYHLITDNLHHEKFQKIVRQVLGQGKKISLRQLNETIFVEARDEKVAEIILGYGKKKTIVFCESIRHANNFCGYLPGSRLYHSGLNHAKNHEALGKFRSGECKYIITIEKMNECIDVPDVELVVFLRCTNSMRIFLQQLGRGLRKTSSKSTVIVLDFVANAKRVMMVREIVERIKAFAPKRTELEKSPFYIKGFFNFIFTDEQIDLFEVLKRLEHSKRNIMSASEVLAGTNQKVWWKCRKKKCGHEWLASGNNRLNGSGCPACAHQVVTTRNNLVVTHPELAREYSSKNSLPADKVIAGGARKFWWKCSKSWCGFEWRATGQSRVSAVKGNGCPACAHRIVTALNNLAVTHPELAREYSSNNLLPADKVVAGTGKKLWWKCANGHEWQAKGADRVNGHGCPLCWNERRKNR
jgi:superfamily II DNA or RNA helicase